MSNCHCNRGINLDGSGQLGRYLKALDPKYAPIDDRSIEDLLLFAKRYAGQIRFYDIPGSIIDDGIKPEKVSWREFFRRDMAVIASSIAVLNITNIKKEYDEVRERLDEDPSQEKFKALFNITIGMAARMDRWYSVAIPDNPLRTDLDLAINSHLRWQMKRIMAYEDRYKSIDFKHPLNLYYLSIENDVVWGLKDVVDPFLAIYEGSSLDDQIRSAALIVDDIFNDFYCSLQSFIDKGPSYMSFALEQYPSHQPHMTLFIAFLQIFRLAQEQMNGLTGKMLDFYYKEVLQLTPKGSLPDKAHIIFELAKDITQYPLNAATSLSAGKDASGKEQIYQTETELVLNQAKVKELKTIFIQKGVTGDPGTRTMVPSINAFYARPIAKSADGFGEKITDPGGKWNTFGQGTPLPADKLDFKNPCTFIEQTKELVSRKDQANVGFAIASPQLLLEGGKRIIKLYINNLTDLIGPVTDETANAQSPFEIFLTGEKSWINAGNLIAKTVYDDLTELLPLGLINPTVNLDEAAHYIDKPNNTIFIYLPVTTESVINFDAKVHTGYDIRTTQPVLRVMLRTGFSLSESVYNQISFSNIMLDVRVGSILADEISIPGGTEGLASQPNLFKVIASSAYASSSASASTTIAIGPKPFLFFDGLRKMVLQNDDGLIAPDKPFDPFTAYPFPGKSLYIGSKEIFNKPLGQLGINILKTEDKVKFFETWAQLDPKNVSGSDDLNKYSAAVLQKRFWQQLTPFANNNGVFTQSFLNHNILFMLVPDGLDDQVNVIMDHTAIPLLHSRIPLSGSITEWKQKSDKGFIRITNLRPVNVTNAMGNSQASQNMASSMQIKEISVSYHSPLAALESETDQFFHIYPFGAIETHINTSEELKDFSIKKSIDITNILQIKRNTKFDLADKASGYLLVQAHNKLLPQFTYKNGYEDYNQTVVEQQVTPSPGKTSFDYASVVAYGSGIKSLQPGNNQYSETLQEQGMLFIGIEKLEPLQTISLLFQFADGSAEDEDQDPPPIHWSYLTNNEWRPMRGEDVVSDGTYGFQTTGIIKLNIPADATSNNTIITKGLHWFSVSVTENANRIPKLINVMAQAVEAVFIDNDNDQKHFDTSLPAGTISKLSVKVAEVSKVVQPFASFDGKHKEISKEFYTRVSERLRHKNRAINSWDYEHLVLDRFPSIYKVKCITATDPNCLCREGIDAICCGPQIAPGHVLLVPISNLKNRNSIDPLQPKTSRRVLLEMEAYLKKLTSPFVKVHAKNPVYEQVIVGFKVQFYTGTDKGFYLKKLNEEIVQYLTPWAFDENADIQFGQKIYASSIINFIEERPYVDFITDFVMSVCKDECCPGTKMGKAKTIIPKIIEDVLGVNSDNATAIIGKIEGDISEAGNEVRSVREILAGICGCDDLEKIIGQDADNKGEIVAIPSTARSILVSVPQHIIIPYTAPEIMTPCEKRKQEKSAANPQPALAEVESLSILKEFIGADIQSAKDEAKIKTDPGPVVDKTMKTIVPVPDKASDANIKVAVVAAAIPAKAILKTAVKSAKPSAKSGKVKASGKPNGKNK